MNYTEKELADMGIRFGNNVQIHRTVLFFGENVQIGSNVRIDCYSVITSDHPVIIGSHIHIGAGGHIFGTAGVNIHDFSNLSSRCSIFSTSDDYIEGYMTNPTVPDEFKQVTCAPVRIEKHVIIGCGSVVMPGITIGTGASVGALSLVNKDVPAFQIVGGIPIRPIGQRDKNRLMELEERFKLL